MKKGIHFTVELLQVLLGALDLELKLAAPVFHELAKIGHVYGDIVHEASSQMDVLLIHESEDLLGADIEFSAYGIYLDLHDSTIILG